ncbi:hypothetical protein L1286_02855 [Pseudoalteromonas sp. SMS1]|uniref:hypothetical protein n=1 Tax=Pseudoalteromonas sp. SMS1 TaxID=2908894 RepID=UPI001F3C9DED|nr:hypothetical protein [Pseudoalteromonas sp. SMS1]MCF2856397.1 hypothetical protein [Pseudoalteromonas sp. SMS1]
MIGKLTSHLQIVRQRSQLHSQVDYGVTLKDHAAHKKINTPISPANEHSDYVVTFESPEEHANRAANLEATLARPTFFGFGQSYLAPHVTITGLGTDNLNQSFQFGELTDKAEIDDFIAQANRLPPTQRHKFQHLKPTQALLALTKKLSDEDLAKFADIVVNTTEFNPKTNRFNNLSETLIDKFNHMSEETLKSALHTMSHLLEQGEANDFSSYAPPAGILDAEGRENALLNRYDKNHHPFARSFGMETRANLVQYANMLLDNTLSDGQLLELNAHIDESNYETNVGIIDMAKTIRPFEQGNFFAMLNDVDKTHNTNVFSLVSKQLDWREHKHYLQTSSREYVINHDALTSEGDRKALYSNMLNAYEQVGLDWMNEVSALTFDAPPKSQLDIWHTLMEDLAQHPKSFMRSDSLQSWVDRNVGILVQRFAEQQVADIHRYNDALDSPFNLSGLSFIDIGK